MFLPLPVHTRSTTDKTSITDTDTRFKDRRKPSNSTRPNSTSNPNHEATTFNSEALRQTQVAVSEKSICTSLTALVANKTSLIGRKNRKIKLLVLDIVHITPPLKVIPPVMNSANSRPSRISKREFIGMVWSWCFHVLTGQAFY